MNIDRIAEWIDWMRITAATTTIAAYLWELRSLERWAADRPVLELKPADLARYLAERRVKGCGNASIKRSVNAFRSFYAFALKGRSPAKHLRTPPIKRRLQRTLSENEEATLLASIDTSSPRGKRDLALVCLMLDTGLREAEVCRLAFRDVSLDELTLKVIIKGGDEAEGLFSAETAAALATWIGVRPTFAQHGIETLFVSVGGLKPGKSLTGDGLRVIFRRLGQVASLDPFSPHALRRTFATQLIRNGASTRVAQVLGRWKNIQQVEQYSRALRASEVQQFSPVRGLLNR